MIGVIPNILLELIKQHWGYDTVDRILDEAGIDHAVYHSDVYYPDEEWERLFAKTLELIDMDREEFEWAFGRYSGEYFKRHLPNFIRDVTNAREQIARLPHLPSMVATPPHQTVNHRVRVEEFDDHSVIHYTSPNHMCTFQRSLVQWMADEYETPVEIDEVLCTKKGDQECQIHVRFLDSSED